MIRRDTYKKILRLYIPMAYPWDRVNISQPPKYLRRAELRRNKIYRQSPEIKTDITSKDKQNVVVLGTYKVSHRWEASSGSHCCNASRPDIVFLGHTPWPSWGKAHLCLWCLKRNSASEKSHSDDPWNALFAVLDFYTVCPATPFLLQQSLQFPDILPENENAQDRNQQTRVVIIGRR